MTQPVGAYRACMSYAANDSPRPTDSHPMTPDEFRQHAHSVVDYIADYLRDIERFPVNHSVKPGEIRGQLPSHAPEAGESIDAIMADMDRVVLPGILHWQHPRFFGYFPSNSSGASLLGDFLSSGLGVQGMSWSTSPACTEIETLALDWLAELLGLPAHFNSASGGHGGGVIQDTASSATLSVMVAARERATAFASDRHGLHSCEQRLTAYTSVDAHSHVEKDMRICGLGSSNLRLIGVDSQRAMDAQALAAAVAADISGGYTPFMVVPTLGTTSTHAFDPLRAVGEVCQRHSLWMHVDAAHAGIAAICPEFRGMHDGLEYADSYSTNPHKWLGVNFDCTALWVKDRRDLIRSHTTLPEYLRNAATESGAVIDYRDWHVPLGRRFRALKLWFVLRHEGAEGLRARIRRDVALAQEFRGWVVADPRFEITAPAPLSLVCFRLRGSDAANEALLARVQTRGRIFITHTKVDGRFVLRMAVGQTQVQHRHLQEAWTEICACAM